MGNGLDDGVALGPLVNKEGRDKVIELVDDAVSKGAKVLTGGKTPDGPGFFYPATVLTNVSDDAKMLNEEIFGPVASIQTFKTEDEAIKRANDTEYGLVAYLYTKDLSRGMRVSEKLDFGMIGLNRGLVSDPAAPFGGIKQSGLGREGAHEGHEGISRDAIRLGDLVSARNGEARGRSDAAARRDRRRGQDHEMVQGGRRRREAGRQPVRDRDRQDLDGSAGDQRRHADRDPFSGRRGRQVGAVVAVIAGAGGAARRSAGRQAPPPQTPLIPAKAGVQSRQALGPRLRGDERTAARHAYPRPMRSVPRGAHARAQFRPGQAAGGAFVTPLARRLAGERGIDLSRVSGSGPHGRIVAARRRDAPRRARPPAMATGASAAQVKALYEGVAYEEVPLDGMRATIAQAAGRGQADHPAFLSDRRYRRSAALIAMREEANAAAPKDKDGEPAFKLSLNDFIIKAWAAALQRVPAANAVWAGRPHPALQAFRHRRRGRARRRADHAGDPQRRGQIAHRDLGRDARPRRARARARSSSRTNTRAASSAISNLGMYGVREFAAIINPPHATILAVGASRRAPVETEDGGVKFVSQMTVTLSCDHRVVDGALGAELLAAFKELRRKAGHRVGLTGVRKWLAKSRTSCWSAPRSR